MIEMGFIAPIEKCDRPGFLDVLAAMPIEELRRRIQESRAMTTAEVEQKQRAERRQRAEVAAASMRHA